IGGRHRRDQIQCALRREECFAQSDDPFIRMDADENEVGEVSDQNGLDLGDLQACLDCHGVVLTYSEEVEGMFVRKVRSGYSKKSRRQTRQNPPLPASTKAPPSTGC